MVNEDIIRKYSRDMRISEKIDEKNSKALWDILSNFDERIFELENKVYKKPLDEVKSAMASLQSVIDWANDYPNARDELDYNSKLWKIAREFIIEKGLDDEFTIIANKKMH